jgi:hypothetical protein
MINQLDSLINIVLSSENIDMPGDASAEILKGIFLLIFIQFIFYKKKMANNNLIIWLKEPLLFFAICHRVK